MSFTTVTSDIETRNASSIFLTPAKRQRVSNETGEKNQRHFPETNAMKGSTKEELPSTEEIWRWTMTSDATVMCFAKDVFDMKENLLGGADFYWLGRVPCRTVRLVGLVVGVQVYESRILYSIDDGTAVIDCVHRARREPKTPTKKDSSSIFKEMPAPMARIGRAIRVAGKIRSVHGTRQIQADEIELCCSANEEPLHWRKVRELHRTYYDLEEEFAIPPPAVPEATKVTEPSTPSTAMPTPVSSVANSPIKPVPTKSSPPKLRHPSRLHSRDLTDNTFRIYVKHYMIYAPSINDAENNTELESFDSEGPTTPTKPCQTNSDQLLTPRPWTGTLDQISRIHSPNQSASHSGFTLSYLRRVPELAELARRVVLVEAKRRNRDQRKKENEDRRSGAALRKPSSGDIPKQKRAPKIKRLFKWAIVQLLQEGSIVLWDGPMRPCKSNDRSEVSLLWKTSSSVSAGMDSTICSASCGASSVVPDIDEQLSDPATDEEGYVPVTPSLLAARVEKIIAEFASPVTQRVSRLGPNRASGGATKEGILSRLHKDDRWKFIGEWQVQDTLDYLRKESRVWCLGQGRWELTLSAD